MVDLMCPARVACLCPGGTAPALAGLQVARVYCGPDTRDDAGHLAAELTVPVESRDGLAEVAAAPLRRWLFEGELAATAPGGESGQRVLDRFATELGEIADRHRGQTVAVVSGPGALSLGLAALCAGLAPRVVCERPLPPGVPVLIEYDGDGWRYLSGWPPEMTA